MKKMELMKAKYAAFKQRPITWGDYIRYAEVCLGISAAVIAVELIYFKMAEHKSRKELEETTKLYSFDFGEDADEEEVED